MKGEVVELVCVRAKNTVGFVESVFECYQSGKTLAVTHCENADDFYRETGLDAVDFISPKTGGEWLKQSNHPIRTDNPAQVVFTSGTEGKPKAIVLSHGNLANVVERINASMSLDSSVREYVGVPVYHSFGLGRCRAVAAVNGEAYIPQKGFDLFEIKSLLDADKINALSLVPSLCRVILDNPELLKNSAHKVKWIEIGSQFMSADEKKRFRELFYKARIVQHYGLTEASRTTLLQIDGANEKQLESVGTWDKAAEVSLTTDGRLKIKGDHVAIGRIENGKITPLTDELSWFKTSDLCKIDEGYLYFKGRADDVINCGGIKFDPARVESQLNEGYEDRDCVYLSKIPDSFRGDGILLSINRESSRTKEDVIGQVGSILSAQNINAGSSIKVQYINDVSKTPTGKIKRKELSANYLEKTTSFKNRADKNTVAGIYANVLNIEEVGENDSFSSLGGDSLTYIRTSVKLEKLVGYLPDGWEKLSVSELSSLVGKTSKVRKIVSLETGIVLRFLAILFVVSHHSGLVVLKGGATLLMLIAGYNYARFQFYRQLQVNPLSVFSSLVVNILVPYWIFLIGLQLLKGQAGSIHFLDVLLVSSNFFPKLPEVPFQVWFVQTLFQAILIFTLPLLLPGVRVWVSARPMLYTLIITCLFLLLRVVDGVSGFGESMSLEGGQTSWTLWLFGLGALMFHLEKETHRVVMSIVITITAIVFYLPDLSRVSIIIIGGLTLLWLPRIQLPSLLTPVIQLVSSASLFVYIIHGRAPIDSFTADWVVDIVRIGVGVLLGVVFYLVYGWGIRLMQFSLSRLTK